MKKTLFENGVLIADKDNPCVWALEVWYDEDTVALVEHNFDGPKTPFLTLDRKGALSLLKELAEFLGQDA